MNFLRQMPKLVLCAVVLSLFLLSGCQESPEPSLPAQTASQPTGTPSVPTEPDPTEPIPTSPANGNPDDVTCQGSYTADTTELAQSAQTVVATVGDTELTNAMLQLYYQIAVNTYRQAGGDIQPDYTKPLDVQLCPLDGTAITWQQFFLQQALTAWHSHNALTLQSHSAVLPLEEAYQRDEKKHQKSLKTEIYNLDLLYGYNTDYRITETHQAYLDSLPELLSDLADAYGFSATAELTAHLTGLEADEAHLAEYARVLNEGYMYLTALSYYLEPTPEEVEAYYQIYRDAYTAQGIDPKDRYVNLRHILLIPEGAQIAENGSITASQESWDACAEAAEKLLKKWKKTETDFSDLAFRNSADTGSASSGGLYENLIPGQLSAELDAWCFDAARQEGDTTLIRTDCGWHILYYCEPTPVWFAKAEADLTASRLNHKIALALQESPMQVDYSAIVLRQTTADTVVLGSDMLLYPDIAYERYPRAPLYFQQDYPDTMYGEYPVVTHGCGITTMSMLASYMTDQELTPPEFCALYGRYCTKAGTAHALFTDVPLEWDFHVVERVFTWDEALDAMQQGYMVVSLQRDGYWTRGGHYLLLHNLIETEDGTKVQVHDSNLYNYEKLEGHTVGYFDLSTIPSHSRSYWIYQKKVTRYDTCVRCGEPTEDSHVPFAMFAENYTCPKCETATLRRNTYLSGCAGAATLPPFADHAISDPALMDLFTGARNTLE